MNIWCVQHRLVTEQIEGFLHCDMDEITDDDVARLVYGCLRAREATRSGHAGQVSALLLPITLVVVEAPEDMHGA